MMLTSGGMTGRIDRLEQRGLVRRLPHPSDRRALVVTLTPAGHSLVEEAVVAGLQAQRKVLERLPAASRDQLASLLRDLLAAAADGEDGEPETPRRDRPQGRDARRGVRSSGS
jgi:DNA-binding MarR family transcriptional regulator